jgi:uridine kinase
MTTKISAASRAHYSPPWADVTIIGIAGSSGSGKSTLSHAIVSALNLPWVVILSMVTYFRFYNCDRWLLIFNVRIHFTRL